MEKRIEEQSSAVVGEIIARLTTIPKKIRNITRLLIRWRITAKGFNSRDFNGFRTSTYQLNPKAGIVQCFQLHVQPLAGPLKGFLPGQRSNS
jgi:hypothetical protein